MLQIHQIFFQYLVYLNCFYFYNYQILNLPQDIVIAQEIIFKTKEVDLKRNSGARCDQAGKKTIVKILNKITVSSDYTAENTKKFENTTIM